MFHHYAMHAAFAWMFVCMAASCMAAADAKDNAGTTGTQAAIQVRSFLPVKPLSRAQRPTGVEAVIENTGEAAATINPKLILPGGVRSVRPDANTAVLIGAADQQKIVWEVEAQDAESCELRLELELGGTTVATASLRMGFLPPVETRKLPYIPEPNPVQTTILVGAHNCPLWV